MEFLNLLNVNLRQMKLDELKAHKKKLVEAMKAFLDSVEHEKRDLKDDEAAAFDKCDAHLDLVQREIDKRPVNQPPAFHATYGEGVVRTASAWGVVNHRYEELFQRDGSENQEPVEQFLARAFSMRTMLTGTGVSGGFLVPEQLWSTVFNAALAQSIAMQRCRMFAMQTSSLVIPALDSEDQSAGWTGGVTAQWRAEGATFDIQTPNLRQITLGASKLGVFVNASNELLQDAPNLESVVRSVLVDGVTNSVDNAIINGTGVGQPLGFLNQPAAVDVNRTTASQINYADIAGMYARLHPSMIPGAIWIGSPDIMPELLTLEDPASQYIWMPSDSGVAGPTPGRLLGLPLFLTDKTPTLGTRGDLSLVNLNYFALGIRKGATVESTNSAYWTQDLVSFRCIMRVDGTGLLDNPITPANGGDTLSCFVVLN